MPLGNEDEISEEAFATTSKTLPLSSGQIPENTADEKLQGSSSDSERTFTPPNGGLQAWLLVVAGFLVFSNVWGIVSTFGAFQKFYIEDLLSSNSASTISWIGSVQAFLVVFVGVFAGPLFDQGYLRSLIYTGCFLTVFGLMMTSLANSFYQVILAQGVCVGLGAGLTYVPTLAIISRNFTTKRPIAIGIASVGSSVGGVVYPIMFRKLEPQIGFGWTVRCLGFIAFAFAAVICAILGRQKGRGQQAQSLLDMSALREPLFQLWTLSLFFLFLAYYIPLFFVVSYAKWALGTSEDFAFYMLAVTNGGSFIGRTAPYLLGQRVKPIYTLLFASVLGVILIFAWIAVHSSAAFVVWCVLWGFVAGVLVTAPTSTMPHPTLSPSMKVIGTRMGMSWSAAAVGSIIGAPIAGALTDVGAGDFLHAQIFGGAVMAAGAVCALWPLVVIQRYDRSKASSTNI